jgi:nicotinate phosphoribosyltransferase
MGKVSIPSKKLVYRLYGKSGEPVLDLMQRMDEPAPRPGERIFCRHAFDETKRCFVTPDKVESLLQPLWGDGGEHEPLQNLEKAREFCAARIAGFREDHLRPANPTAYKR